jgi:hypothetical protein
MKIGIIFDEFNVTMNPKSKVVIASLILIVSLVFIGAIASGSAYEFGEEHHFTQVGYKTSTRNSSIHEPFVLNTLFAYSMSEGVVWNLTVTENVSVYTSTEYFSQYTFNGTGGFYEGNHTVIRIAVLLNGTEGSYEYNIRHADWDAYSIETKTFVLWRFFSNLAFVIMGVFAVFFVLVFVNYASLRKNGGNGPDQ